MAATKTKLEQWKAKRETGGQVTLPSGTKVRIEVPNIVTMLAHGEVPNELVKYAADTADSLQAGLLDSDIEKIKEASDYLNWLVATTIKEPEGVTADDVKDLPTEDTDMILEFALRQREVDALGHQLYGMETNEEWRKFRFGR